MKYKLFTATEKFWNALQKDIQNAQKTIYIEMYIFIDDTDQTHDFVKSLIAKAKEGIQISLVLDAFGSRELKKSSIKKMQAAGIEILFFSDRLRRTHRKIVIIDEYIGFFGGANIHGSSHRRLDMQIRIRGKKSVKPLLKSFAYTYKMCGGLHRNILHHYKKGLFKKIKSYIIENLPGHKGYHLTEYYKEKIITAQKSIKITTPYFLPPRRLIALLDNAQRRGVKIEIIIPKSTDISSLDQINRFYMNKVLSLGITFYMMKHMNHAKILIIDEKECLLGSQNIDKLSLGYNQELGASFTQKNIVKNVLDVFEKRKKNSIIYSPSYIKLHIKDKIIGRILRIVFYFM